MDTSFCISHKNLLPIFVAVINAKLATLYELKNYYYYEDILDLFELVLVNNYNETTYNEIEQLKADAIAQR
jgi:hypothetical protein